MYAPIGESAPQGYVSTEGIGNNAEEDKQGHLDGKHTAHAKGDDGNEHQLKLAVIFKVPIKPVNVIDHTEGL